MATKKMSGREGFKSGPVRFKKEDFRSGKVEEVRKMVKFEEMKRDPILASGPESPPVPANVPDLQRQLMESIEIIKDLKQKLQEEEDFTPTIPDMVRIQRVKKIKKVKDEICLLVDLAAPGLSTRESQIYLSIKQLKAIKHSTVGDVK